MHSILNKLDYWISTSPNKTLFEYLDINGKTKERYTYKEFDLRTDVIAHHLLKKNKFQIGDRIILAYPPGLEMICAFFACIKMGLIPVPVYPPSANGFQASSYKMNFIAEDCDAACILTDRAYFWTFKINLSRKNLSTLSFKGDFISKLDWIVTNDFKNGFHYKFERRHSDILFLQYTSGSTNQPKGVIVSHLNILNNCENVVDHQAIGVSWLPQYHDMGLIGYYIFFAIRGGTTYGFSPLDFIQRPSLWLETITKYKGTASSAPNFAYEFCMRPGKIPSETLEKVNLSSLRFLMTAAEPVRTNVHQAFIEKFVNYGLNPESIFSAYGLAEFTLAVSNYGREIGYFESQALKEDRAVLTSKEAANTSLLSCGIPLGDTKIRIVKDCIALKDGEVGEIWLDGTSKCDGYWKKPELTRATFNAKLRNESTDNSWLKTGDLGFMWSNELFISGRMKDMIIIRGQNYYPQDIEVLVENDPKIRKGCVTTFSIDRDGNVLVVVVAELRDTKSLPNLQQINNQVVSYVGVHISEIVLIKARTLPKTSSGKLMRFQTKKKYVQNTLNAVVHYVFDAPAGAIELKSKDSIGSAGLFETLYATYHLAIDEPLPIGDAGLDSLKLTEFAHDLKHILTQLNFDDLSQEVDLRLLQKIAASELYQILVQLQSSSPSARFIFRNAFSKIQNEFRLVELEMMKADHHEFKPEEIEAQVSFGSPKAILITGGTGFFGPFLIKSLLQQNVEDIYVLVRANDKHEGLKRLLDSFHQVSPSEAMVIEFKNRIIPVCGDLSKPNLGLAYDVWDLLSKCVEVIYHNGAMVNYLFDYESMRDSNVQGTKEILKLSSRNGGKTLNLISTTFIFGWSTKDTLFESDSNHKMKLLDFGYSQTKWVVERLVMKAMKKGLKVRIFRPALISPSIQGEGSNFDISIRLLAFMDKYGITTSAQNQVSFTPADIAANNIVAISNIEESINKSFHVTRDEYAKMQEITHLLGQFTNRKFTPYTLPEFVPEVVSRCEKSELLFPLLNFLLKSVDNIGKMEFKRYDNSNYVLYRDMSPFGISDPELTEVVGGIYKFMSAKGIIEKQNTLEHV